MYVLRLEVNRVRNLSNINIDASANLNIVTGANGSGKSSLIESIFFLSRGRSFRTRKLSQVVQRGGTDMFVAADMRREAGVNNQTRVGMERTGTNTVFKMDGNEIKTSSQLAKEVPVVLISPGDHLLLEGGPSFRRRWLDMGVFHMEHRHLQWCKEYSKALRHRNALLRGDSNDTDTMSVWEEKMSSIAELITAARERYIDLLAVETRRLLNGFAFVGGGFSMTLKRGWPDGMYFTESLVKYRSRDNNLRYTHSGPHAADVNFVIDGAEANWYLSRGRQKVLFTALSMAVARVISKEQEPPVVLVDDLVADLDMENVSIAMETLSGLGCQVWVTAVDFADTPSGLWPDHKRFHVKLGNIRQI